MKSSPLAHTVWEAVDKNEQAVAVAHELVTGDAKFTPTDDQTRAVATITAGLAEDTFEFLLKAPTGAGKTEVLFRVAVTEALRTKGYVTILAPTRELVRQDARYFRDRLVDSGLEIAEIHGGVSPKERRDILDGLQNGTIHFLVGSAMLLDSNELRDVVDHGALVVIDDVNAFDEHEHLRMLEGLDCPLLFASATPNELRAFLERVGAYQNIVTMKAMPFAVLPTKIHKVAGVWGEPAAEQLARANDLIRDHLERGSRIFVIGRTRGDVPKLAERLESLYEVPVQQLRGDMVDSNEQRKRYKKKGLAPHGTATRIEMMKAFLERTPAILAATNLVGSGLDIPAADLIVLTDADAFGESEVEQLIGRVGRRERPSDAVLITDTTLDRNPAKSSSGGPRKSFMPAGMHSRSLRFRR